MSSMNDAAINAKEDAAKELAKLLPSPENLANLSALRSEYAQRQQANDSQLSSTVTSQVEQAKSGISALAAAQSTIAQLQNNFVLIEQLCKECDALIENHDQIKQLNTVRNNLNKTLKDAEGMLSIQTEAEEAQKSLDDARELVKTYERLTALEGKRRIALAAAESRPQEAGKLREYFEDVSRTKEEFEQRLWGYIRDFFKLAKKSPQTLVRALRVVEMQEILDEQVAEEEAEAAGVSVEEMLARRDRRDGGPKDGVGGPQEGGGAPHYKDMCYQQIQLGVNDRFHDLLTRLVYEDLQPMLDEATTIVDDLQDVHKYVAPCFPQSYDIVHLVVQYYSHHFVTMLQKLSDRSKDIKNLEILKLVKWLHACEDKMVQQLGVEEAMAILPAESGALDPLIDEYVNRMSTFMRDCLKNILEMDKSQVLQPGEEDGPLYTAIPVDVFRLMVEQVDQVRENSNSLMLFKTARAINELILDFQQQEMDYVTSNPVDVGLEHLCAMVNNNVRCHGEAVELGNLIVEHLEPKHAEELDFTTACEGFLDVAKEASSQAVECIFVDEGVRDLVAKVYQKEWLEGIVTQTLIATLEDYFADIRKWIEERSFRRTAEICLERTIVVYVDLLLQQKQYVTERTIERLKLDEGDLKKFFEEFMSAQKLDKRLQPLVDLRNLAASDSVESFVVCYTQLLSTCPDCPPEVVRKIVSLRDGIPSKEAKEVVQECKDVWTQHLASHGSPKPSFVFSRVKV